jgi:hypothetical protein
MISISRPGDARDVGIAEFADIAGLRDVESCCGRCTSKNGHGGRPLAMLTNLTRRVGAQSETHRWARLQFD